MNLSTLVLIGLAVVWAIVLAPEILRRLSSVRRPDPVNSFHRQMTSLNSSGQYGQGPRAARQSQSASTARPSGRSRVGSNVVDLRTSGAARRQTAPSTRKRRQDVLVVLVAAALLTLLCTVAFGGPFLMIHLLADLLLVGYVVLLNRTANVAPQQRRSIAPVGSTINLRASRVPAQRATVGSYRRVSN
jgi:hypothetical protein